MVAVTAKFDCSGAVQIFVARGGVLRRREKIPAAVTGPAELFRNFQIVFEAVDHLVERLVELLHEGGQIALLALVARQVAELHTAGVVVEHLAEQRVALPEVVFAVECAEVEDVERHQIRRFRGVPDSGVRRGVGEEKVEHLFRAEQQMVVKHLRQGGGHLVPPRFRTVRGGEVHFAGEDFRRDEGGEPVTGEKNSILDLPRIRRDRECKVAEETALQPEAPPAVGKEAAVAVEEAFNPLLQFLRSARSNRLEHRLHGEIAARGGGQERFHRLFNRFERNIVIRHDSPPRFWKVFHRGSSGCGSRAPPDRTP